MRACKRPDCGKSFNSNTMQTERINECERKRDGMKLLTQCHRHSRLDVRSKWNTWNEPKGCWFPIFVAHHTSFYIRHSYQCINYFFFYFHTVCVFILLWGESLRSPFCYRYNKRKTEYTRTHTTSFSPISFSIVYLFPACSYFLTVHRVKEKNKRFSLDVFFFSSHSLLSTLYHRTDDKIFKCVKCIRRWEYFALDLVALLFLFCSMSISFISSFHLYLMRRQWKRKRKKKKTHASINF